MGFPAGMASGSFISTTTQSDIKKVLATEAACSRQHLTTCTRVVLRIQIFIIILYITYTVIAETCGVPPVFRMARMHRIQLKASNALKQINESSHNLSLIIQIVWQSHGRKLKNIDAQTENHLCWINDPSRHQIFIFTSGSIISISWIVTGQYLITTQVTSSQPRS